MPSTVGLPKQRTDAEVVTQAAKLEFDCVAAYREAAKQAHTGANANAFAGMAQDCARHLNAWQDRLVALGQAPTGANAITEPLNSFKVKAASWLGDRAIVTAVRNNSADSCEAYARVKARADLGPETLELAAQLLGDAERHRDQVAHMPYTAAHGAARPTQS